MLFSKVTKQHILSGIKDFKEKGFPDRFKSSSTYDLFYEGEYYPPKAIMVYANYHAEGRKIEPYFKGGVGTDCFMAFERNGFTIMRKKSITTLIANYKTKIKQTDLKDERYKWELLDRFKGRPDLGVENLLKEIKSIDYSNLMYAMSKAVIQHLVAERPEQMRGLFNSLFDEKIDLNTRVKTFNEESLHIYREIGGTLQHHQGERAISTYLTFCNTGKYTFYKYSFYKKYCKLLGIKQATKNERYGHYLELVNQIIVDYIEKDEELISLVKKCLPEYYDGTNNLLLTQDILFQMLDKTSEVNYWIFQGNPDIYNITNALKAAHLKSWKVAAHKENIAIGDKVIIWQTGKDAGCYALAEVTSEVGVFEEETVEKQYYVDVGLFCF